MNSYLEALDPAQHIDLALGGKTHRVQRARFGLHLHLNRLALQFDRRIHGPQCSIDVLGQIIKDYLDGAGIEIEGATGTELLTAYAQLRLLNQWQWELPFMRDRREPGEKPPYDYPDRIWAWQIHKLASRYGWSKDEIFNLWPEEMACYLQEIFISEFDEAEERRSLSEIAYRYDKISQKSRYIPLSRPRWMLRKQEGPGRRRMRRNMLPLGNVIDLGTVH